MKTENWDIDRTVPYDRNPRLNDAAVDAVARSIQEFGFRQPIVVDEEGVVLVGHTRLKAARKLGLAQVPVHVATDLTEAQKKAYRIADNKTAELAEWDPDLLPLELFELQELDFDMSLLGFSDDEMARLLDGDVKEGLCDPDEIPEPPDEPVTKPGDLWILGDHRLLCGDSANPEHVDRLLDGGKIHLVNTDPPYNVKVEPRSNNAIASHSAGLASPGQRSLLNHQGFDLARYPSKAKPTTTKMRAKDRPLSNDFISDEDYAAKLSAWFGNMARVLLSGRSFYVWAGAYPGSGGAKGNYETYPAALREHGLKYSQLIIWDKQHPVLTRKDMMGAHESCFYGWKEGAAHNWFGPNNETDLWHIKKINPQSMVHLCLHPDAQVLTESGYRTISSIAPGDRVYSGDGSFHPVSNVSSHRYASSHLYRIRARGGNETTDASDNHPFLIWRPHRRGARIVDADIGWVRADEVRRGDYTMTPILDEPRSDPFPDRDEKYWFLFGLYLAQGTIQKAGHGQNCYPSFHVHKKRQDLVACIHDQWDSVSEYDPNEYGEVRSQGLTVMAFDPQAGAEFERLGGQRSYAKGINPAVLQLPRAKRLAVLRGWLNGDGCQVHDRTYWQGNTVSADLAAQLCLLGESVGYRTNLYAYDPPDDLGSIDGRCFQSQRRTYYLYFYDRSRYATKRGSPTTIQHEGRTYTLRYVRSVERIPYAGDVWNLTVDGHPSFQTAVGMSHNTEKPVELAVRAIQYSSRAGENVLDLFGGSGSTLIGCEQTGRRAYLMEIDPAYCDVIVERWEKFTGREGERESTA